MPDTWSLALEPDTLFKASLLVGFAATLWGLEFALAGRLRPRGVVVLMLMTFVPYVGGLACVVGLLVVRFRRPTPKWSLEPRGLAVSTPVGAAP